MDRGIDGGRWMARSLLVGLIAASGCHSTQTAPGPTEAMKVEPMHDIKAPDPNAGLQGPLHEWFAQQKIKQLGAAQTQ